MITVAQRKLLDNLPSRVAAERGEVAFDAYGRGFRKTFMSLIDIGLVSLGRKFLDANGDGWIEVIRNESNATRHDSRPGASRSRRAASKFRRAMATSDARRRAQRDKLTLSKTQMIALAVPDSSRVKIQTIRSLVKLGLIYWAGAGWRRTEAGEKVLRETWEYNETRGWFPR